MIFVRPSCSLDDFPLTGVKGVVHRRRVIQVSAGPFPNRLGSGPTHGVREVLLAASRRVPKRTFRDVNRRHAERVRADP
jgi:hypothetical protein